MVRVWLTLGLLVLLLAATASPAFADRAMTPRFSVNDTGNIAFAANTLMVCPASAAGCTAARNTPAIASGSNAALDNNGYDMQYVNTAPGSVPAFPPNTPNPVCPASAAFDSSSAMLSLPATATVLFAGLYWGGDTSGGSSPSDVGAPTPLARGCVGFRVPGASGYTTLSGAVDQSTSSMTRYGAFADVTSLVATAGSGTYSVANVQTGKGGDRYAGWTLVVAYEDPTQPPRNLTVEDGFVTINSSAPPTTIPITGFRTPPTGPVRTTLGFVAYEGDSGLTGDSASLNGTKLSDGANPANNFFNGGITNLGLNVTTRNPNDVNNWDYDSKLVNANGILPNNATSANILVTTSGDTYYPAVVTLATDLYAPQITSTKTVTNLTHPGGPDQLGDTLQYTVSYANSGSDAAANFVMRDSIPAGTTYVPGSLRIGGSDGSSTPTDALGDDAGEFNPTTGEVVFRLGAGGNGTTGGTIRPGATDTATFRVTINPGDTPGQQIVNQATATFTGLTLGTAFSDTSPQVTNTVSAPSLSLSKSHLGGFVAGQATTFSLAVSNVGTLATSGAVTVTDPFPASSFSAIANANGNGWSCQISGLTLTCTRSDALAAGNSYPPIFVDGIVQDPAPATISNTATVSGGGSRPASDSDGGGANGLADLSITKSADSALVANGDTVTYTLNVQNAGPSSAQNVTVSDPIDTSSFGDVAVQASQGSCDTTVSCSLGTVAANGSATITITATVNARDTPLTNTASVSSSTPDPNPTNNSASASITVPATADLAIAKTSTTSNPNQGAPDSYTLTIFNNGPDSGHNVVVNDTLPSQFTAASASGTGFTCTVPAGPGGTVVCTDPSLAPTGSSPVTITITGTVAAGTAGQTIADAATVSSDSADPDLTNNTATFSQLIGPAADLTITKTALQTDGVTPLVNPLTAPFPAPFVYQLMVTNNGPTAATAVTVTDPLPNGISYVSSTSGQGSCSATGQLVTCSLGTVNPGAANAVTINLDVTASSSTAGTAPQNTANVTSATPDPNPSGTSSATATIGVGTVANLAVSKTVSPQTANVGDVVTYTLTGTNDIPIGESNAAPSGLGTTGGVITDTLPPGLQFVSSSTCTAAGQNVTCHLGPIAQGQVVTATYTALVTPTAAGTSVTNLATIASEAAGTFPALADYNPSDNTDSATLNVNPLADLSLSKTVSNTDPAVDDEVDYTLTASNAGPNDATGVTITDPLPAGLDFIDATPGCDNQNGTVTCDLGTVPAGGSASVTIRTVTTGAIAGTAVTNLATVSSDVLDPNPANNQASATIDVQPLVDLALTKVASNPAPAAGGPVTYTLTLVNNGPSPATGATITDPLPSGLTFASASAGQGSCSALGQAVVCNLGTLAAGGTAVVSITANVAASDAGATVQNTAGASADDPIAQPELLSAKAIVNPVPAPVTEADLDLSKTVNHTHAQFGTNLKYEITIANHGPATATTPTVTDAFSASAEIVSVHSPTGSCSKHTPVTCKLDSIAPGATATITLIARGDSLGELRNTASVATPTPVTPSSRTLATAKTEITPGPHSRIILDDTAAPPTIPAGGTTTFMPKASDPNPWPLHNVKVCDRLPTGTMFVAASGRFTRHVRLVCWKIATIPPHGSKTVWTRAEPLLGVTGTLRDAATATASPGGRRLTARASAAVHVVPGLCGSARDLPHHRSDNGPLAVAAC